MNLWGEVATLCGCMALIVLLLINATGRERLRPSELDDYAYETLNRQHPISSSNCSCTTGPQHLDFTVPDRLPRSDPTDLVIARMEESEELMYPPIRILSWTALNMASDTHEEVWFGENGKPSLDKCYSQDRKYLDPKYQCIYTNQKKEFNVSDAVLFRGRRMAELPMPKLHRMPHQKWVFWEFEPPYKVWWDANLTKYGGVFNMTATYSRDSDVPNMHYLDNICVRNYKKLKKLSKVDYTWKKKRRAPVVWFASVCKTQSKREKYVKRLQKYITVDVYGDCGTKKCGSNRQATWPIDRCDEFAFHSNNSYKFFLAFENSLCDDYVTEKLWKTITPALDVVPIVMGTVDYANILPKDSYIDVRDFASPKELAKYLQYLDSNDEAYNQYLRNKHSLNCQLVHRYMPWQCRLCQRLHELRDQTKVVYDLARFWGSRRCMSPLDFEENRKENWDFRY